MLARKILLYLIPPVVAGCIIAGIYLGRRQTPDQPAPLAPPTTVGMAGDIDEADLSGDPQPTIGTGAEGKSQLIDNQQVVTKDSNSGSAPLSLEELTTQAVAFSESPFWLKFLAQSEPAMRLVKAIDAVAHGERPLDALDFLQADSPFTAQQDTVGNWLATRAAYARYQGAVDFVDSLEPATVAEWFVKAEPALQKCCGKLGYQDKTIRQLLTEACNTVLTTPRFDFDPLLMPTGTAGTYHFVDPAFEQLNDAQKLLVRLGPENCEKVQAKCEAIADALHLYQ